MKELTIRRPKSLLFECPRCREPVEYDPLYRARAEIECPFCGAHVESWERPEVEELRNEAERQMFEQLKKMREASTAPLEETPEGVTSLLEERYGEKLRAMFRVSYEKIRADFDELVEERAEQLIEDFERKLRTPPWLGDDD